MQAHFIWAVLRVAAAGGGGAYMSRLRVKIAADTPGGVESRPGGEAEERAGEKTRTGAILARQMRREEVLGPGAAAAAKGRVGKARLCKGGAEWAALLPRRMGKGRGMSSRMPGGAPTLLNLARELGRDPVENKTWGGPRQPNRCMISLHA